VRRLLTIAVIAAAAISPSQLAHAADTGPPQLVEIQLSQSTATINGLDVVDVEVRVHLTDDTGVVTTPRTTTQPGTPLIQLVRTGTIGFGAGLPQDEDEPPLTLTSGTAADGWWTGTAHVTSQWNGNWDVDLVQAYDAASHFLGVDPRQTGQDQNLAVTGTHIPTISMGWTPNPARCCVGVTVKGRLTYADTGEPLPHQTLALGLGGGLAQISPHSLACASVENGKIGGTATVTTDANGYYTYAETAIWVRGGSYECLAFGPQIHDNAIDFTTSPLWATRAGQAPHLWGVTAVPATHTAALGQSVDVNGTLQPYLAYMVEYVALQRLVSGQWRTVTHARVRASGRYTAVAQPPSCGNHRYRVLTLDTSHAFRPTSTTPFLIGVPCTS